MAGNDPIVLTLASGELLRKIVRREMARVQNPVNAELLDFGRQSTDQWIPFTNGSTETMPANGIGAIAAGFTYESEIANHCLSLTKPSTTWTTLYAVNSGLDIAPGDGGVCCLWGPCEIIYASSDSPTVGAYCGPKPGQWTVTNNYPATSQVLGVVSASTPAVLYGTLGPIDGFIGKLAGSLSQGSNAAVTIWAGAGNSEAATSFDNVTCFDWLMKSGATAIASGKKVVVKYINGIPYVIDAECA